MKLKLWMLLVLGIICMLCLRCPSTMSCFQTNTAVVGARVSELIMQYYISLYQRRLAVRNRVAMLPRHYGPFSLLTTTRGLPVPRREPLHQAEKSVH